MTKSVLVIVRQGPYGTNNAREALDAALTSAVFELDVAMLFLSDAVFQLIGDQSPAAIGQKNLSANLQVLPMYDVEKLYVCAEALQQRNLAEQNLKIPAEILDQQARQALIDQFDVVLNF